MYLPIRAHSMPFWHGVGLGYAHIGVSIYVVILLSRLQCHVAFGKDSNSKIPTLFLMNLSQSGIGDNNV